MARRPVDCGELEDLGAGAAWDDRPGDDALPADCEDADPEERGWADLLVLPPPLDLVYPPPLTTRPLLVLELEPPPPPPPPPLPRSTTMIGPYG